VKLLRRRPAEPEPVVDGTGDDLADAVTKGRPTPKRRDSTPRRGPASQAPRNRKEAYRWQKQQRNRTGSAAGKPRSTKEYREAIRSGDPTALPRRDQGPARKLARDWVDSRRMLSNYLLLLFPLMIVGYLVPFLNVAVIALFVGFLGEWYVTGRRIRALALERNGSVNQGPWALGFYAGSRAYMPRRWRMPRPQVSIGDEI